MRPKELTMEGFISFSKKTTINFDQFTNGIFILDGITGAGKTAILDAICFALYGKGSGERSNRQLLRCNSIAPKIKTVVELTFEHEGSVYFIHRSFTKNMKTSANAEDYICLEENKDVKGSQLSSGYEKVTEYVTKVLLGIDHSQFTKIIMLPQGKFKEFLLEKPDGKYNILKSVRDVSKYERYSELLNDASRVLSAKRKEAEKEINQRISDSDLNGKPEYTYGEDGFADNLSELVSKEEKEFEQKKDRFDRKTRKIKLYALIDSKIGYVYEAIESLETNQEAFKKLKQSIGDPDELENRVKEVSKYTHQIKPEIKSRSDAQRDINDIDEKIKNEEITLQEKIIPEWENAKKDVEKDKPVIALINSVRSDYEYMENLIKNSKSLSEHTVTLKTTSDENFPGLMKELSEARSSLESIVSLDKKKKELEEEQSKKKNTLDAIEQMAEKYEEINKNCDKLSKLKENHKKLHGQFEEAKNLYDDKFRLFVESQAYLLADDTKKLLREKGECNCPVCGMHLTSESNCSFAEKTGECVDEKILIGFKNKMNEANKTASEFKEKQLDPFAGKLEIAKQELVNLVEEHFDDCGKFDNLSDVYFENKRTECSEQNASISRDIDIADSERCKMVSDVQSHIDEMRKMTDIVQATVDSHAETEKNASAERETKIGIIKEHKNTLAGLKDKLSDSENKLKELLGVESITDDIINDASKVVTGIDDPENWIISNAKTVENYRNLKKNCEEGSEKAESGKKDILKIINEIGKLSYGTDALFADENKNASLLSDKKSRERLERTIDKVCKVAKDSKYEEKFNKEFNTFKNKVEDHIILKKKVTECLESLAKTDKPMAILKSLSECADPSQGAEGGKLSFARYVMGSYFAHVIERSNDRLEGMTDKRFSIRLLTTAKTNAGAAGVDVEIYDDFEGCKLSKEQLSGGQGFIVSLALALGMSDVAQESAENGVLKSLFIDEGFGTLDEETLGIVKGCLTDLTTNEGRLIGIITHVKALDIGKRLVVKYSKTDRTSYIA